MPGETAGRQKRQQLNTTRKGQKGDSCICVSFRLSFASFCDILLPSGLSICNKLKLQSPGSPREMDLRALHLMGEVFSLLLEVHTEALNPKC